MAICIPANIVRDVLEQAMKRYGNIPATRRGSEEEIEKLLESAISDAVECMADWVD